MIWGRAGVCEARVRGGVPPGPVPGRGGGTELGASPGQTPEPGRPSRCAGQPGPRPCLRTGRAAGPAQSLAASLGSGSWALKGKGGSRMLKWGGGEVTGTHTADLPELCFLKE